MNASRGTTEGEVGTARMVVADPGPPLVWKFGGTSLADRLRAAAERMVNAQRSGRGVVAVLSAMGRSTDARPTSSHGWSRPPLRGCPSWSRRTR